MAVDLATTVKSDGARRRARAVRLSTSDRVAIALMLGIPTVGVGALVGSPPVASIVLSSTNGEGRGGAGTARGVAPKNSRGGGTIYPPFWPAVEHNAIWL